MVVRVLATAPEAAVDAVVATLRRLDLRGPPAVTILVTSGPGLLAALAACADRVIVVATRPLDPPVLDAVIEGADDLLDWDDGAPGAIEARIERWRAVETVLASPAVQDPLVGSSPAHREAVADVVELACFSDAPVLLTGETGTGKEVTARLLHSLSARRDASFVVVDCTTIVPTLSGSELFGHERGAYTGAVSTRTGAIAAADGGTLFLDEVGELPLSIQAELLRVVQEGTYKRVGGDRWLRSRFRLVCATNRDLRREMAEGRFRPDLYHRISAGAVELRPLRERREDIPALFTRFLTEALGRPAPAVSEPVLRLLATRPYPGNLRDLRQLAVRVAARHPGGGRITVGDVPPADRRSRLVSPAPAQDGPAGWSRLRGRAGGGGGDGPAGSGPAAEGDHPPGGRPGGGARPGRRRRKYPGRRCGPRHHRAGDTAPPGRRPQRGGPGRGRARRGGSGGVLTVLPGPGRAAGARPC